jgi:type IV pilus biogenesis protein PilP
MLKEIFMRKNNHLVLAAIACAVLTTPTFAQSVPSVATVGDLASIQSETLLGKAKLVHAQVYADLRKVSGQDGTATQTGVPDSSIPQVTRIVEANGVSEATLAYANGRIDAREGDRIPGGFVLSKIRPDTSIVQLKTHNGRVIDVPVSSLSGLSTTPTGPQPAAPNGLMMLPPPNPTMPGSSPAQAPAPSNVPHLTPSLAGAGTSNTH